MRLGNQDRRKDFARDHRSPGRVDRVNPAPIPIGGPYIGVNTVTDSGNEGIGFDIANGNTWEVWHTEPGNSPIVFKSGSLLPGAVKVQNTWTDAGVPAGMANVNGSILSTTCLLMGEVTSNQ